MFFSIWKFPANAKHLVFFIKVEPFVPFHNSQKFCVSLIGATCRRRGRCHVTLSILLSSKESIQRALNLFLFGHFGKLYFERKYRCHQGLEKNTLYFLLDVFEAFVFGNSSFALTLLALFGKIEIKGIIYRGNFTRQEDQWQKTTRFGQFLLVFDEWTTAKFEHCRGKCFL